MDNDAVLEARGIQKISIADLLEKELKCRKLPPNWKIYPENDERSYLISGNCLYTELTSPYQKIDLPRPGLGFWGATIGKFTLGGVIQQDKNVLAFQYAAHDRLPSGVSYTKKVKEDVSGFIESQRQQAFANYLHLKSLLRQENSTITMVGKVQNIHPRLFLPYGIAVKAGEFQAVHGSMSAGEQDIPVER